MSDDKSTQQILDLWLEVRTLVDAIDADVHKNARGVAAAGVRCRKGFRTLKRKLSDLSKVSLASDQTKKPKET